MNRITMLDENTINKIAAGEVIERPSSIVKELIENSIDANANSITINIKNGGKKLISISDDGNGISKLDIPFVFERHATSKIRKIEDLWHIESMGFRGEAMASIAAVSEIELMTKFIHEEEGSYIQIEGGNIKEIKTIGHNIGTTVIVRNIFFNTPARLKFLKSDLSEQISIVDLIERISLINTTISFKLIIDDRVIFHTPGNGDLLSIIHSIYGNSITKSMLKLDYQNDLLKVNGYISKIDITRNNSKSLIFSVNKRLVKNKILTEALRQSYKTYLMNGKYPVAIINIFINQEKLDINVHPSKAEIKFEDEKFIFNSIYYAVKKCLDSQMEFKEDIINDKSDNILEFEKNSLIDTSPITFNEEIYKYDKANHNFERNVFEEKTYETDSDKNHKDRIEFNNIIGQLFNTYIILQSVDYYYLVDQHAAHERILYEYIKKRIQNNDIVIQHLLLPITIDISTKASLILKTNISILNNLGFEIDWFGSNTIRFFSIPLIMGKPCSGDTIQEIIDDIVEFDSNFDKKIENIIKGMSCKNAIKAGDNLSKDEIINLIKELNNTENPFTCPHGRPTAIKTDKIELDKKFKRIL